MSNSYYKRYQKLLAKQKKVEEEIEQLQNSCPHENVSIRLESDTGNWASVDDAYSVDVKCSDCGMYRYYDSERHPEMYNYWTGRR